MAELQKEIVILHPRKIFFWEAFLFSITFFFGLATALRLNIILTNKGETLPFISFWQFIFSFLFATFFLILLLSLKKFQRGKKFIFKTLFAFLIFLGGVNTFSLWMPSVFAFILIAILVFVWLKFSYIFIHNFIIAFAIAGMSAFLGLSLSPLTVVLFLVLFSIYDWISVYKTKHMVKLAKEMIEARVPIAFICPQEISDLGASLKEIQLGGKFLILGGGDVAFPLLLSISLLPEGIFNAILVALFALIGLSISFLIFIKQKTRQPIPALPPIALCSIIGFLATKLIF